MAVSKDTPWEICDCAQFDQTAMRSNPEITVDIEQGKFNRLHQWLKDNIYQHGSKYTTSELLTTVTGKPLTVEPFVKYIHQKYKEYNS